MNAPANIPANLPTNLPVLIEALPSGDAGAAHNQFTRERQVVFLEALAVSGSVRSAARRAGVSHQTVYRAKRACMALRRCVDAALLCARDHAEEELRCRAVDGVEEEVLYHGEVVAVRRRYCSRLLLAHLGRLDKLAEREDVSALADGFDAALAAFAAGEELPGADLPGAHDGAPAQAGVSGDGSPLHEVPACAGNREGEKTSPEPCNTRSMAPPDPPLDPAFARFAEPAFWRHQARQNPGFDQARWLERVHAMLAARPGDAPPFDLLVETEDEEGRWVAGSNHDIRHCITHQVLGFEYEERDWWSIDLSGQYWTEDMREWDDAAAEDDAAED